MIVIFIGLPFPFSRCFFQLQASSHSSGIFLQAMFDDTGSELTVGLSPYYQQTTCSRNCRNRSPNTASRQISKLQSSSSDARPRSNCYCWDVDPKNGFSFKHRGDLMEIYYGTVKRIAFAWDSAEKPKNPMVWRGAIWSYGYTNRGAPNHLIDLKYRD